MPVFKATIGWTGKPHAYNVRTLTNGYIPASHVCMFSIPLSWIPGVGVIFWKKVDCTLCNQLLQQHISISSKENYDVQSSSHIFLLFFLLQNAILSSNGNVSSGPTKQTFKLWLMTSIIFLKFWKFEENRPPFLFLVFVLTRDFGDEYCHFLSLVHNQATNIAESFMFLPTCKWFQNHRCSTKRALFFLVAGSLKRAKYGCKLEMPRVKIFLVQIAPKL